MVGEVRKIILDVHGDDCALFSCWTLLREKPLVVVVYDSYAQPARGIPGTDYQTRRLETFEACAILGVECKFLGFSDADASVNALTIAARLRSTFDFRPVDGLWAPAFEMDGHEQHNLVAMACSNLPIKPTARYLSYTRTRGKSTNGRKVPIDDPKWIGKKLRALACYESQFQPATGCAPHFIGRSLEEYYA